MLELISYPSATPSAFPPLLFVHGAWHGAWCWEPHFLPYFAANGFNAHALSLRGHGQSGNRRALRWTTIADYVADVATVAQQLPQQPVLIGHSMGGLVVQKYLEGRAGQTAVLLASAPPQGVLRTTLNIARHHTLRFLQANLTLSLYPLVNTPALALAHFFSSTLPDAELNDYAARLQDESYRAFLDMLVFNLPRPKRVQSSVFVLSAANDTIFTPAEATKTAQAYRADCTILPNIAHDMMLDPNWQTAADAIINWLR